MLTTHAPAPSRSSRHSHHPRATLSAPHQPYPLSYALPPYDRAHAVIGTTIGSLPEGAVLILDVDPIPADLGGLNVAARKVRSACAGFPLVLRARPDLDGLLYLVSAGGSLPIHGVVLHGQPLARSLRSQLTRADNLPAQVTTWLSARGVRMAPALTDLIRQIFLRAPRHAELSTLCREIGAVESSARFRCSKKRLPPPSRWLQAARALHAALRLQSDPERAMLPLALELGYSDHSALSHQLRRTFGVRPREVRRLLGWEWLLDRWFDQARASAATIQIPHVTTAPTNATG